ncbi:MAG: 16S rRNA (adenine(1518)-N(6)/adenine(1519)-N(6))-dimethyltransferase [Paenibacillus sp. RIFOXYA1_FULL_44_5]|nr:MAG: 16S rRNA (adenine(1518)-N(6)/adenine(1519)-N(6))-dimethyltransferase [Paenibacillus sp. RIFOXYA1_FULL_44_5]
MKHDLDSPLHSVSSVRYAKEVMQKYAFTFKKSLGQNFLIDANILDKIVSAADLDAGAGVLEIGPGIGALTEKLAQAAHQVVAVEIDQRLIPILQETMEHYDNVQIIQGDILQVQLDEIFQQYFAGCTSQSVVANLPYYVTTPILMRLLEEKVPIKNIVVMIQKEVADRMTAAPGGKNYGSLSIAVQYYCQAKMVTIVPHTVFIPQPNVDSAVIKLSVREKPPISVQSEAFFFQVVQAAFKQRRKTLYNNLRSSFSTISQEIVPILDSCEIDPSRRAETLHMEEFAKLSNAMLTYIPQ